MKSKVCVTYMIILYILYMTCMVYMMRMICMIYMTYIWYNIHISHLLEQTVFVSQHAYCNAETQWAAGIVCIADGSYPGRGVVSQTQPRRTVCCRHIFVPTAAMMAHGQCGACTTCHREMLRSVLTAQANGVFCLSFFSLSFFPPSFVAFCCSKSSRSSISRSRCRSRTPVG